MIFKRLPPSPTPPAAFREDLKPLFRVERANRLLTGGKGLIVTPVQYRRRPTTRSSRRRVLQRKRITPTSAPGKAPWALLKVRSKVKSFPPCRTAPGQPQWAP